MNECLFWNTSPVIAIDVQRFYLLIERRIHMTRRKNGGNREIAEPERFFCLHPLTLQESRAHRIKAKLLSFWEWMGDLRGFGKLKTFQTKYFLWRILVWLLLNTTCIASCQVFKTSLAGRLIEAISQVNLNQFSKNMRGIEPQFHFLNFER